MKIINGKDSGRNIFMPAHIRPTQNLLRKAVFDIVGHNLEGMIFLDLFAGSGAMALEALSCGAAEAYAVERDPLCLQVIHENTARLRPGQNGQKIHIINKDAFATVKNFAREGMKFDIVFFDPPFDMKLGKKALKTIMTHDILHPNSIVIAQYGNDEKLPDLDDVVEIPGIFSVIKDKVYGVSRLTIIQRKSEGN